MEHLSLKDLLVKYGDGKTIEDWSTVSHDDLYQYLDSNREGLKELYEKGVLTSQEWAKEVRRRSKQDLEWLAGYMTHETNPETSGKPITENMIRRENHAPFFDFFVKKDESKSIAEQSTIKSRLLLYPRGSMKSSTGLIDVVQWVLNFPEIRILILTAAENLAVSVLDEVKGHFLIKIYEPTLMNYFFPEFCLEEKDLSNQYEFTCPVWARKQIKRREPTIMASSITATLSGYHFEVLHCDDMVSNRNSENEEQCVKVAKNFKINKKMLRSFGYCTKIGTRYHDSDMYGSEIDSTVGDLKITKGQGWEMTYSPANDSLILVGRAITVKPDVRDQLLAAGLPQHQFYEAAGEEGCILLMPNVLTYKRLLVQFNEDRFGGSEDGTFEGQMNQNPVSEDQAVFDMPTLLRSTIPYTEMPFTGLISHTWDFAFSSKERRDFTTGSSVIWGNNGCAYVNDLVRDRFPNPTALAKAIVAFAEKHKPFVIGIEDAGGSRLIEPTIQHEAQKTGDAYVISVCSHIDWIPVDHSRDSKRTRMATLQPLLVNNMMKFAAHLPYLQTLYEEFMRCQGNLRKHNDIPDVISQQPRYAPRAMQTIADQGMAGWTWTDDQKAAFRQRAQWNMIFEENCSPFGEPGGGAVTTRILDDDPLIEDQLEAKSYAPGLDPIFGGGLIG